MTCPPRLAWKGLGDIAWTALSIHFLFLKQKLEAILKRWFGTFPDVSARLQDIDAGSADDASHIHHVLAGIAP